jgi:putative transposase
LKLRRKARKWVYHFVNLYNTEFLHSGIKFVTPHQRHYGLDIKLLEKRNEVYKKARAQKPERWSKGTRDWSWIDQVALNPAKESEETLFKKMRQLS